MPADTRSDNSIPIDEIVEKLRTIKRFSPELYQEAWDKLPRKTQSAILSYEEHHKPTRAHTSHTAFEDHEPLTPHHASTPKPHGDHQRPSHTHTSDTDYEALSILPLCTHQHLEQPWTPPSPDQPDIKQQAQSLTGKRLKGSS